MLLQGPVLAFLLHRVQDVLDLGSGDGPFRSARAAWPAVQLVFPHPAQQELDPGVREAARQGQQVLGAVVWEVVPLL